MSNPELGKKYPLAMISPSARNFLNSTFVNVQSLRDTEGEPHLDMRPSDAAARDIEDGILVRIFNDRGSFVAKARVTDKTRRGLVVGLSIWWRKFAADGKNANEVACQRLTDMSKAPIRRLQAVGHRPRESQDDARPLPADQESAGELQPESAGLLLNSKEAP
jgi:anaerobic selenocysteine-containing dehydrogenase